METVRRTLQGVVVKISSAETIKVRVERKQTHPLYGKVVRTHKNYLVHCPQLDKVEEGDLVLISPCKPVSKNKTWEFIQKLESKK